MKPLTGLQEIRVVEKGMGTHSSILAWRITWTEEPGGLQTMGSQRVRHDQATEHTHTHDIQTWVHTSSGSCALTVTA